MPEREEQERAERPDTSVPGDASASKLNGFLEAFVFPADNSADNK